MRWLVAIEWVCAGLAFRRRGPCVDTVSVPPEFNVATFLAPSVGIVRVKNRPSLRGAGWLDHFTPTPARVRQFFSTPLHSSYGGHFRSAPFWFGSCVVSDLTVPAEAHLPRAGIQRRYGGHWLMSILRWEGELLLNLRFYTESCQSFFF